MAAHIKKVDLARTVGVTPQSISYYLAGSRVPHRSVVSLLAQQLNVSVDWLLRGGNARISGKAAETMRETGPDYRAIVGGHGVELDDEERATLDLCLSVLRSGEADYRLHLINQLKLLQRSLALKQKASSEESAR